MLTLLDDGYFFVQFVRGLEPSPMFIQALCPKNLRVLKNMIMSVGETEIEAIRRLGVAMGRCKRLGRGTLYKVEPTHLTVQYAGYIGQRDRYYEGWDKRQPL